MSRFWRQKTVALWAKNSFGEAEASSLPQRGLRLLEEATETVQATGVSEEQAIAVVKHVYNRPVGELAQELGGVGVTTLALANAANLDADYCEDQEVRRIISLPTGYFTARNNLKKKAGLIVPELNDSK